MEDGSGGVDLGVCLGLWECFEPFRDYDCSDKGLNGDVSCLGFDCESLVAFRSE